MQGLTDPGICSSTGMKKLDIALGGGLFAGKAYGIQARKKTGKTLLMGTISYNMNELGIPHLWVAAEMNDRELEHRHIARGIGCSALDFLTDNPEMSAQVRSYAEAASDNILYANAVGITIPELKEIISRAVKEHDIHGFFLDYLQLVRATRHGNRTEHLEEVAQVIAEIIREHQIWCMVAAQLNQDHNTRGGEGMLLAFDMIFSLHRNPHSSEGWLEMKDTRYTPYRNIGSEIKPGLKLEPQGPFFSEIGSVERESSLL
jgi:predicted ATP-dependent serine protease